MVWGRQASSLVGASGLLRTALLRQADWVLLAADQVATRMLPAHLADMEVHMLLPKDPESERLVQWVEGGERSLRCGGACVHLPHVPPACTRLPLQAL